MIKVIPVGNRLLVKCFKEDQDTTKSGLKIVRQGELWSRNFVECEVLAVGEDAKEFKIGQVVMIKGHDGDWLNPDFFEPTTEFVYRIIEKDVVQAILEKEPTLEAV